MKKQFLTPIIIKIKNNKKDKALALENHNKFTPVEIKQNHNKEKKKIKKSTSKPGKTEKMTETIQTFSALKDPKQQLPPMPQTKKIKIPNQKTSFLAIWAVYNTIVLGQEGRFRAEKIIVQCRNIFRI
jgi:hypothetical protein